MPPAEPQGVMTGKGTQATHLPVDQLGEHLRQLEKLVEQITLIQARQIDRELNVPGSDPAELRSIELDLAAVRGITHKLVELQQGNLSST